MKRRDALWPSHPTQDTLLPLAAAVADEPAELVSSARSQLTSAGRMSGLSRSPRTVESSEGRRRFRILGLPLSAVALLLLCAAISVIRSHYQLLWGDEFGFGLLSIDSSSTLARLIHIELSTPVSFDPIGYNALIHAIIRLFGTGAFAMRLPSIAGYLLMQVCLFHFVRRIASERAAIVALALPALAGISIYSVLSRPYGLLLGLSALAMLSWQTSARRESERTVALVFLALSVAMAVNTQYYGVLLFVPLCAAELTRTLERRRIDVPMLASILAGMAGVLLVVPFARALSPFRANHTDLKAADVHFITHSYLWILIGYAHLSRLEQHLIGACTLLLLLALVAGFACFRSKLTLRLSRAEAVFLLLLCAFPIMAYLIANFVTHFVEARYIQPALIGLAATLAVLMAPLLQNKIAWRIVLVSLFAAIAAFGILHIRAEKQKSQRMMASLVPSAAVQRDLDSSPGQPIYITVLSDFEFMQYYAPDAGIRSRITFIYPKSGGLRSGVRADVTEQMINMRADDVPHLASYAMASRPGTESLFLCQNPGDWPAPALAGSGIQVKQLGRFFGFYLESVRFPPAAESRAGAMNRQAGSREPPLCGHGSRRCTG